MSDAQMSRGYSADDLDLMAKQRIRDRLAEMRPELFAKGVEVIKQKKAAETAFEALRVEIHKTLGGDGVLDALRMFEDQATGKMPPPVAIPEGIAIVGAQIDAARAAHNPKVVSGNKRL